MSYKLQNSISIDNVVLPSNCVIRLSDNAVIPFDPANTDYQEFLKKKAEGVKVYAADETIPDEVTE